MTTPSHHHYRRRWTRILALLLVLGGDSRPVLLAQNNQAAAAMEKTDFETATRGMKSLEATWPEIKASLEKGDRVESQTEAGRSAVKWARSTVILVADTFKSEREAMVQRLDGIDAEITRLAATGADLEAAAALRRSWESDVEPYAGWQQEKAAGFDSLLKAQTEANEALGLPKTAQLGGEARRMLKHMESAGEAPAVKALRAEISAVEQETRSRLVKAAEAILSEAGKTELSQSGRDRLERFSADNLRLALDGTAEVAALQQKAAALVAAFDGSAGASAAGMSKALTALTEQAGAHWPSLASKIATETLDASAPKQGSMIRMNGVANRMGWDFKPGEYDFATTQNGRAIVGRFSEPVRSAVAAALKQTGLDALPEQDYSLIARVAGSAQAVQFEAMEGDVRVEGSSERLKVTGRKEAKVEAVLLDITGLYVGPVAVVAGHGSVAADGSVQAVAAAGSGGSTGGFLIRLLWCLAGLAFGFQALVKARSPLAERVPAVARFCSTLAPAVVWAAGLAAVALGVWGLIRGNFFHGLLFSLTFIAAGAFLASERLVILKILPAPLAARLQSSGGLIALAMCALAIGHLLLGGMVPLL